MSKFRLSPASIAGAAAVALAALSAPAANAAGAGYYRAELAQPAPDARFVARDVVWSCSGTNCTAAQGNSRPQIMCAALAKKVGAIARFAANGTDMGADELARCNGGK